MIRSELVEGLAGANPHLQPGDAERVVAVVLDTIAEALARGGRVELRGFGAFSTRARDARTGRNPRTGDTVVVDAKRVPHFKPGKEMRAKLNLDAGTGAATRRAADALAPQGERAASE